MAEMHARTFLCREGLWQQFEEIAREQGAPIDEVLSEAMRSYARQRSYGTDEPNPNAHDYAAENAPDLARTNAMRQAPPPRHLGATMPNPSPNRMPAPPSRSGVGMPLPPPPPGGRGQRVPATAQMPAPPPRRGGPLAAPPPPPPPQSMRRPPQQQSYAATDPDPQPWQNAPQQAPPQQQAPPPQRSRGPARLSLTYAGRHVEVTKERFVLGRSKSQADLVLEDPNVSRQHAAIELQGSEWMLVDLGSTNGCYVDGQRVTTRPIQDGDLIEITTHQVHCTLR